MATDCREFVERLRDVADADVLWETMLAFFHARGAIRVSYRHFWSDRGDEEEPTIFHDGFPDAFVERYRSEQLYRNNPVATLALGTTEPFYWSDTERVGRLTDADRRTLEILRSEISGDGVVLQLFGPKRRNGTVNLGFEPGVPRLNSVQLRELQLVAQAGHLAYCRIVSLEEQQSVHGLTAREQEVLEWISKGKSNSVIADILEISAHTVDTHVRRIFRKLEVNDRTTAAIKGLGSGLVHPAA